MVKILVMVLVLFCLGAMVPGGAEAHRLGPCCRELLDPGCPSGDYVFQPYYGVWCQVLPDRVPVIRLR